MASSHAKGVPRGLQRLRRHFRRGCDRGSASMASYVVAAAFFLMSSTYLLNFVIEPPGGSGSNLDHAELKSKADQALGVLMGSRGWPLGWEASGTSVDDVERLGLIETGTSIRIDPNKFDALARGKYATSSPTNGFVDYAEAKEALGLSGYDFHVRAFPVLEEDDGAYGTAGLDDYRIAYVGDWSGLAWSSAATTEATSIATLDVGFDARAVDDPVDTGDMFKDNAQSLRQYLVPLIGSGISQTTISEGSGTKFNFMRVNKSVFEGFLATELTPVTTALALSSDGVTLGYSKGREMRATLGVANLSSLESTVLTWKEWVDTDRGNGSYDPGDYGYMELSANNGQTWCRPTTLTYTASDDSLINPSGTAWRTRMMTIDDSVCPGVENNANVIVAAHWVGDNDNSIGYGWILDDVQMQATAVTGFDKTFESPEYDLLIMGSNVDQTAFTPDDVKSAIRDYVDTYGGRIVVLGGETNTQWLEPLFHVGIQGASPGVSTPDTTHPLLTVPNDLDWSGYSNNNKAWDFSGSADENLFSMVVGTSTGQHLLSVSAQGAFGGETSDGVVMLTTYLPYALGSETERLKFFANAITYGRFHYLYMEVGPEVPTGIPVASVARSATMNKLREGAPEYVEMGFVMYLWKGQSSDQTATQTAVNPTRPQGVAAAWKEQNVWVNFTQPDSWGGASATKTGYEIWRGYAPGYLTTKVATLAYGATSWRDTNVTYGTTYHYNVTAISGTNRGTPSASVSATPITTAGVPTGLSGNALVPGEVRLSWSAPASNGGSAISGYAVWVNDTGTTSTFSLLAEIGNTTSYSHLVADNVARAYRVTAMNGAGHSLNSTWVNVTAGTVASAPQAFTVTHPTPNNLTLAWTAPLSSGTASLSGYTVYRSTDGSTWTTLATLNSAANVSYVDAGLGTNVTRYYRVAAITAVGAGANTSSVSDKTMAAPNTPGSPLATRLLTTNTVTWLAPASDAPVVRYDVWRGSSQGAKTTSLGSTTLLTLTDTGGANNSWYVIEAVSAAGTSQGATVRVS